VTQPPCKSWGSGVFLGPDSARERRFAATEHLRAQCGGCGMRRRCLQSAADSPFRVVGVWGGLLLPEQEAELPDPTRQLPAPANGRGLDPDLRSVSFHTTGTKD
jgi:hypothetical protein